MAAATEIQERLDIPAMAVTGHLTAAEAEAAGILGFLSKPYTWHALQVVLDAVAAWLETGSAKTLPQTLIGT